MNNQRYNPHEMDLMHAQVQAQQHLQRGNMMNMNNSAPMGNNMNMGMGMGNNSMRMGMMGNQGPMGAGMQPRGGIRPQNPMMMQHHQQQQQMMPQHNMMQHNMGYNNQGFNDGGYGGGQIAAHIESMAYVQTIRTNEACLVQPPPGMPPRTCRERPAGCRTVFIGGLPDNCTEQCLRDIFMQMGNVVGCRLSKKNFAHIRFEMEASADYAIKYSGWNLCVGDAEDPEQKQARIHVDYALARDDQAEHDERQKQYYRELRQQMLGDEDQDTVLQYNDHEASVLHEQLRENDSFSAATQILRTWLERGDCSRRNASAFYSMTQTAHSHVRRMAAEKQQFVQEFNSMKERFKLQLQTILMQFEQIEKVFVAAQKQKVWDHFTKAQRKNITAWHSAVQEAKKENVEFALNQRQEDEMELSDQEDDEGAPQQKKPRIEARNCDLQDIVNKLQEENDELKCQLEACNNEMETARQEMDNDTVQKDSVLSFLRTTLHNTQRKLLDFKKQSQLLEAELKRLRGEAPSDGATETETVAEKSESEPTEKDLTETTEVLAESTEVKTESTELAAETTENVTETTEDVTESTEDKTEITEDASEKVETGEIMAAEPIEEIEMEDSGTLDISDLPESSTAETSKISDEATTSSEKEAEVKEVSSAVVKEVTKRKAKAAPKKPEEPMSEMDKLIAQAMKYASSSEKPSPAAPLPRTMTRAPRGSGFKDYELKIVGLLSMFMNLHPYGATSDYICSYLNHLNLNVTPLDIDILLLKLPMLFYHNRRGEGNDEQRLWCFVGFQN